MSQQVSLSRSRSGQAQCKRANRATQTGNIRQKIPPGVQHRSTQGQHKLGYKIVCEHMQPRTEMRPTRPSEPATTADIYISLQTHEKSLRIQQHPANAFTAAIKNSIQTGQAQASKTSQVNTTQHYSTHSSVGTPHVSPEAIYR
jgi:hypothetical protein